MSKAAFSETGLNRQGPVAPLVVLTVLVLGVGGLALRFGLRRHIHVDEFHNVYSMQLIGELRQPDYADPAELYHVIFSWLTRHAPSTRVMFAELRTIYACLFVALLWAVAWTQPFFTTRWGRVAAFVGVATWWPAWRHGYEVRHDTFLAFGVVGLYTIARGTQRGRRANLASAVVAGWMAVWMQLNSHKAVGLWGPALAVAALQVRGLAWRERLRLLGGVAAGGALGLATGFALLASAGAVSAYFAQLRHFTEYAAQAERIAVLPLFEYMLHVGVVGTGCAAVYVLCELSAAIGRSPMKHAVTLGFVAFTLAWLTLNPVPFPYNMVWVTPCVLLAALGGARVLVDRAGRLGPVVTAALLACGVGQFVLELSRDEYTQRSWTDQLALIDVAEELTAEDEPVFDGVGMTCLRPPASRDWLIHSLFMVEYEAGRRESLRDVIQRAAPPVIIGGHYRFGWLPEKDHAAVARHYVRLTKQLWVLGAELTGPEQTVRLLRAGRYWFEPSGLGPELSINGEPVAARRPRHLTAGEYHVAGTGHIVWLGPKLERLPAVRSVDRLFAPARLPGQ